MFWWELHFPLKAMCPSSKHSNFPQKDGHIFLSIKAAPKLYAQGLVCPEEKLAAFF